MGKTRGHGSRRGAYRGRGGGGGRGRGDDDDSEEEQYEAQRGLGGQKSTVGMLPPSDSEDEKEGGNGDGEAAEAKPSKATSSKGQNKNAGKLPPSGSEDEDEDEDEESEEESSEEPLNEYLASSAPRKKKVVEEEPDPEQIRKDMERLELIKQKREADRLKRIRDEGWDRFAPISETNKPPGAVPSDHPSQRGE